MSILLELSACVLGPILLSFKYFTPRTMLSGIIASSLLSHSYYHSNIPIKKQFPWPITHHSISVLLMQSKTSQKGCLIFFTPFIVSTYCKSAFISSPSLKFFQVMYDIAKSNDKLYVLIPLHFSVAFDITDHSCFWKIFLSRLPRLHSLSALPFLSPLVGIISCTPPLNVKVYEGFVLAIFPSFPRWFHPIPQL